MIKGTKEVVFEGDHFETGADSDSIFTIYITNSNFSGPLQVIDYVYYPNKAGYGWVSWSYVWSISKR